MELKNPIDNFFDKVMVNAENKKVKSNRHSLLNQLYLALNSVADISKLIGYNKAVLFDRDGVINIPYYRNDISHGFLFQEVLNQ